MPGSKRLTGNAELVGVRVPKAVYDEMMRLIESEGRWPYPARQNFILEAVREKLERYVPVGPSPVPAAHSPPRSGTRR